MPPCNLQIPPRPRPSKRHSAGRGHSWNLETVSLRISSFRHLIQNYIFIRFDNCIGEQAFSQGFDYSVNVDSFRLINITIEDLADTDIADFIMPEFIHCTVQRLTLCIEHLRL